jgi:hypothetical protein
MSNWTNPAYQARIAAYEQSTNRDFQPATLGNCTNCGGSGRHIYMDSDGTMKDIPCQACGGSGQTG